MAVVTLGRAAALAAACGALGACGPVAPIDPPREDAPAPVTAAVIDEGPIRTPDEYLAEPRFRDADLRRGELLGLACVACHTLGEGDGAVIGPRLKGIFGRPAASLPGFEYSAALRAVDLVWTPLALEAWLAEPATFVPGTTMAFTGYRSADDRRDLVAYLLRATQ